MPTFAFHPAAELFPLMEGTELDALAQDIKSHGLREPIVLHQGKILDGRNRYRACQLAGIEPECVQWGGAGSPIAFVLSMNLHRRHLNESQRAMVGSRAKEMYSMEAKKRMLSGKHADPMPNLAQGPARDQAAKAVNVSHGSIDSADKVRKSGTPELQRAVESGTLAISTAADIATLPQPEQRVVVALSEKEILAKAKEIRTGRLKKRREARIQQWQESCKDPGDIRQIGTFGVLYADPPWQYEHVTSDNRAVEEHYPTMELETIKNLPVEKLCDANCVLFLWATAPKLEEAMSVLRAWHFNYRTCMVWVKNSIGMGYYCRQRHELLLIGTRGEPPTPAPETRPDSVIEAPRLEHSAKPPEVYGIIENMYPNIPRIELFARGPAQPGWTTWGNQAA